MFVLFRVLEPVSSAYCIKDLSGHNLDDEISSQGSSPTGFARRGSSSGSKLDWMEPTLQLYNSNMLLPYGSNRVYDAFHMLQHEPSVQVLITHKITCLYLLKFDFRSGSLKNQVI